MKGVTMKIFTILCILTAMVVTTACSDKDVSKTPAAKQATMNYASSVLIEDLVGNWKVNSGVGKIEGSDGLKLLVTTETGLKGTGKITGDRIEVASWNVTGR